jgi:hypothetical protein
MTLSFSIKILIFIDHPTVVRIHSFIADLPGKAAVLNTKQFNGYFGCIDCKHPGEYSNESKKMIYPYKKVLI